VSVAHRTIQNHYEILGVLSSASAEEIRRAYRILARRYHPDVNPGKTSEDRFKAIAQAYEILSDQDKRAAFDRELGAEGARVDFSRFMKSGFGKGPAGSTAQGQRAYEQAVRRAAAQDRAKKRFQQAQTQGSAGNPFGEASSRRKEASKPTVTRDTSFFASMAKLGSKGASALRGFAREALRAEKDEPRSARAPRSAPARSLSVIEISLPLRDAILGTRKSVEISEPEGRRKVSIRIPAGVRSGSVLRTRTKDGNEELVVIVRVAPHPFLSLEPKGLVAEVPVTIQEALSGANITVPTLDEQVVLKIPAGSQNGMELRLKERGLVNSDGTRGDLFFRISIKIPTAHQAVGIQEKAAELERYYQEPVRQGFPKTLLSDS
jgi:DnaJ-class molecular chaperone